MLLEDFSFCPEDRLPVLAFRQQVVQKGRGVGEKVPGKAAGARLLPVDGGQRTAVEIPDVRSRTGEQKGRMDGNDELGTLPAGGLPQDAEESQLPQRGRAASGSSSR